MSGAEPQHIPSELTAVFRDAFGREPSGVWSAPGRVNLIGEHTDYNRGLCLPMAIPRRTWVAVAPRRDRRMRILSRQVPGERTIELDGLLEGNRGGWAAYAVGVLWALEQAGREVRGLDVVVDGRVPLGSGLSSSAALECAVAVAAVDVLGLPGYEGDEGRRDLAAVCVRAENEVAGAPTGGMDQSASLLARADEALLLDFDGDHPPVHVPFDLASHGLALLVMNTRAEHSLDDGQYGNRREECVAAVAELGVGSLRDLRPRDLDEVVPRLSSDVLRRRVRHVVTETERVTQAVAALEADDFDALTALFDASHASMRDDFEISCVELDTAVETARAAGALAARMTGGGFGGSAIAIVRDELVGEVSRAVTAAFSRQGFRSPELFPVTADGPARRELQAP
ncbi:galactokinase [Intrasporangium calvum]|uniref:Galactokinase n=1 Tax=Intrasporangium calvum TaxID=53358 RepID=A0ABT5GKF2_9MICO|nr:galactokinase [Intrasporangium calvum]MDC5698705.1 galactokinase [Intrasporangium calvum]